MASISYLSNIKFISPLSSHIQESSPGDLNEKLRKTTKFDSTLEPFTWRMNRKAMREKRKEREMEEREKEENKSVEQGREEEGVIVKGENVKEKEVQEQEGKEKERKIRKSPFFSLSPSFSPHCSFFFFLFFSNLALKVRSEFERFISREVQFFLKKNDPMLLGKQQYFKIIQRFSQLQCRFFPYRS